MKIGMPNDCVHEIDPDTVEFDKRGRVGICKLCGCKLYQTTTLNNLKRERPHMSKKERLRRRRELKKKLEVENEKD